MKMIEAVKSGISRQVNTVRRAITTPTGPFEFVDEVVRNARMTVRGVVGGIRIPI